MLFILIKIIYVWWYTRNLYLKSFFWNELYATISLATRYLETHTNYPKIYLLKDRHIEGIYSCSILLVLYDSHWKLKSFFSGLNPKDKYRFSQRLVTKFVSSYFFPPSKTFDWFFRENLFTCIVRSSVRIHLLESSYRFKLCLVVPVIYD